MELSDKALIYIRGAFGSEFKFRSDSVNGEIINTIFGMKQPNFSNNDIVDGVMARSNGRFNRGSVLSALSIMLRKERFIGFLDSCKVPMPKGQKGGKAWMHRFNETVIEDAKQHFKDEEDEIRAINSNQCVGKGRLLKIVYTGGHPNEHPKLFQIAREFHCDLRVVPMESNMTPDLSNVDLIIICASMNKHHLTKRIQDEKKENTHVVLINNTTGRTFKDELLRYLNKYVPEWRETLKELCAQAKKFNRPTMKDVPRTKPEKKVEKTVEVETPVSKECHVESILKECKALIQMAIDDATEKLSDLDINTGSLAVNHTDGDLKVGLGFTV